MSYLARILATNISLSDLYLYYFLGLDHWERDLLHYPSIYRHGVIPFIYALIHHIYNPGAFKDEYYEVVYDKRGCLYTLSTISNPGQQLVEFPALELKFASSPSRSCTYVFVVHAELGEPIQMQNGMLRVIKDQYFGERPFNEPDIFKHIHADGFVPGVIKLVDDESWNSTKTHNSRIKRRLGFEQNGAPFMCIKTVKEMSEAAFAVFEGLRPTPLRMHLRRLKFLSDRVSKNQV